MNPPGSTYAISLGCSCNQAENNFGIGSTESGHYIVLVDSACPLHGRPAWETAVADFDSASLIALELSSL
jgi:hypothetical protein